MMNGFRICASTLIALAGFGTSACSSVDEPRDGVADGLADGVADREDRVLSNVESRDVSGLTVLGPQWTEAPLSWHGGGGGTYTGYIVPGAVIDFVRVRSGAEVDAIQFGWYKPTRADNWYSTGDQEGTTPEYGGGGGGWSSWFYCGGGKGIIGIRGSTGSRVDRIGVVCGDVNNPDPTSPSNVYSPLWGGGGGGWFGEDKCTLNRLVDSFNVRSGSRLDGIQAICVNAH